MMTDNQTPQVWAFFREDGGYTLHYTNGPDQHPSDHGHECGCFDVVALQREPDHLRGEAALPDGTISFDPALIAHTVVSAIKAEAARRIEVFAPIWKQLNDLSDPTHPDALARRAQIDAVRAWSNDVEARFLAATNVDELQAALDGILY